MPTVIEELCDELAPGARASLDRNRDAVIGKAGLVKKSAILFVWPVVGLLVKPIIMWAVYKLVDKLMGMTVSQVADLFARLKAERVPGSAPPEITLD